ncbi:hypothetical protein LRHMDP2_942 [Lacticaseibacillus rhamnosus LRHMDP2]|uniref:Uncharacterized protein n=1 Tax=Lacticaseibacillus rhamnosus LRHMDP3 TaxID=1203259 RepID=A0AB33XXU4_LACRH|nr:hypothetical protein LRHMDP2_942 [Lacticaseibacillus rhamnosus LRHMDP2]EKS53512.1 hypothetical protein LRHMDP3_44 [Lacticaseibacillus rhamnosus LRHMDP3]
MRLNKKANPSRVSFFRISILHEKKRLIVAFKAYFINRNTFNSFVDHDSSQRQDT